jgi:molybdenum cofactor biosynthesis enzyme
MEIRIGIQQSVRELMVEIDDEKAQTKAKAAAEAALTGKTEVLSLVDNRGREVLVASAKLAYVEFGAPEGARKLGFGS